MFGPICQKYQVPTIIRYSFPESNRRSRLQSLRNCLWSSSNCARFGNWSSWWSCVSIRPVQWTWSLGLRSPLTRRSEAHPLATIQPKLTLRFPENLSDTSRRHFRRHDSVLNLHRYLKSFQFPLPGSTASTSQAPNDVDLPSSEVLLLSESGPVNPREQCSRIWASQPRQWGSAPNHRARQAEQRRVIGACTYRPRPRTVGISPQSFENGDKSEFKPVRVALTHQGIQAKVDDQFEPANEARERPLSDLITDLLNRLDISCNCGGSYSIVETSKQFCGARSPQERLTALLTWFSLTWNRVIILFDKYQCCYLRHSTCELVYPFQITSVVPWLFQTGFV